MEYEVSWWVGDHVASYRGVGILSKLQVPDQANTHIYFLTVGNYNSISRLALVLLTVNDFKAKIFIFVALLLEDTEIYNSPEKFHILSLLDRL
jgi:hypothetical protein